MLQTGKIKKIDSVADIPEDCGYMQKFKYNIDMNSNGINGECIEWCQSNCKGRWGWWFEPANIIENPMNHWENQNAFMSFSHKRDATKFWLMVGLQNMGRNNDN